MDQESKKPIKFGALLILSVMAAILSAAAPLRLNTGGVVLGSILFLVWIAMLVFAFRTFRWKSLWFLVGSPFALIFLLIFWMRSLFKIARRSWPT